MDDIIDLISSEDDEEHSTTTQPKRARVIFSPSSNTTNDKQQQNTTSTAKRKNTNSRVIHTDSSSSDEGDNNNINNNSDDEQEDNNNINNSDDESHHHHSTTTTTDSSSSQSHYDDNNTDDENNTNIIQNISDDDDDNNNELQPSSQKSILLSELQQLIFDIDHRRKQIDAMQTELSRIETRKMQIEAKLQTISDSSFHSQLDRESFTFSRKVRQTLKDVFGFSNFRDQQLAVINATMSNRDVFTVLPTGGGKSLLFQLPAVVQGGLTLVVSPLLSLSRDQVLNLSLRGVAAGLVSSDQTPQENLKIFEQCRSGIIRLLYVTPEMVSKSKKLLGLLETLYRGNRLVRLVIDEAHCCSSMGHDFRPEYRALFILKQQFPQTPLLAVTATATKVVEEDIRKTLLGDAQIHQQPWIVFRSSFNRTNLFFRVIQKKEKGESQREQIYNEISSSFSKMTGIVYCHAQKDTEVLATYLRDRGILASPYHAGLSSEDKHKTHDNWRIGKIHVVCATTAFGMGIDKPDVRFVIHETLSKNMESYIQESGRAGRDGKRAECILFYRRQDVFTVAQLISRSANQPINKLLELVRYVESNHICRRIIIAKCFGEEEFDSIVGCSGMCDVCHHQQPSQSDLQSLSVTNTTTTTTTSSSSNSTSTSSSSNGLVLSTPIHGMNQSTSNIQQQQQQLVPTSSLWIIVDHTLQAESMLRCLKHILTTDENITMNSLVDAWRRRGKYASNDNNKHDDDQPTSSNNSNSTSKNTKIQPSRFCAPQEWNVDDCERLTMWMLLNHILAISFSYTSYGCHTYLNLGSKSLELLDQNCTRMVIQYPIPPVPKRVTSTSSKSTLSSTKMTTTTTTTRKKKTPPPQQQPPPLGDQNHLKSYFSAKSISNHQNNENTNNNDDQDEVIDLIDDSGSEQQQRQRQQHLPMPPPPPPIFESAFGSTLSLSSSSIFKSSLNRNHHSSQGSSNSSITEDDEEIFESIPKSFKHPQQRQQVQHHQPMMMMNNNNGCSTSYHNNNNPNPNPILPAIKAGGGIVPLPDYFNPNEFDEDDS
jgi:ATP-dependent DNA helicase Q1